MNAGQPKKFYIIMRHLNWTINGGTFLKEQVTDGGKVHLNIFEAWKFICDGGGMGMMRNYLIIFFVITLLGALAFELNY